MIFLRNHWQGLFKTFIRVCRHAHTWLEDTLNSSHTTSATVIYLQIAAFKIDQSSSHALFYQSAIDVSVLKVSWPVDNKSCKLDIDELKLYNMRYLCISVNSTAAKILVSKCLVVMEITKKHSRGRIFLGHPAPCTYVILY